MFLQLLSILQQDNIYLIKIYISCEHKQITKATEKYAPDLLITKTIKEFQSFEHDTVHFAKLSISK